MEFEVNDATLKFILSEKKNTNPERQTLHFTLTCKSELQISNFERST